MFTPRKSVLTAALCVAAACGPTSTSQQPELYLSANKSVFDGRVDHAVLRVEAVSAKGGVGEGVVTFVAPAGRFVDAPDVRLVSGFATVTFVCNPDEESACGGAMRLSATWNGVSANVQVRVTPSTRETPIAWRVVPTNTLATLNALAAAPDNSVYTVGNGGTVLRLIDWTWTPVASPTDENLTAVTVTSRGTPIAVGTHGTLLIGESGRLRLVTTNLYEEDFTSVSATSETDIDIGSTSGNIFHFDGTSMLSSFAMGAPVLSLARSSTRLWAGGEGLLGVNDGASWGVTTAPVLARFSVAVPAGGKLWLGGARMGNAGGVLLVGPETWHTVTVTEPVTAIAIVPRGDERFALTETSVYRQISDGAWTRITAPIGGRAAITRFATDLVVVGPPGISMFRN